ncbi:probable cytochrome P450 9f2 [Uranotaenia lowii]|uniref:probable cytochrome P450 9f2 n=1 Tax=Uranotaenia lowii TaxID=190385 RepID=UPI00247B0DAF|nr:probable cytochrome P450 9f2 [Uranotaenia lowii]
MEVNLLNFLAIFTLIAALGYWQNRKNDYFHRKPIPSLATKPFIGSTGSLLLKKYSIFEYICTIYNKYAGAKVFGLMDFNQPVFVLRDPELIKQVAVKHFEHFIDRRPIFGRDSESPDQLFVKTLFSMSDQKWRNMRATLSPAFTGSKMRQMFELVVKCAENSVGFYRGEIGQQSGKQYEMKDVFARFATDVIATCAFGIQVDSSRERDNEFYRTGRDMMSFGRFSVLVRIFFCRVMPSVASALGIDIIDRKHNRYFSKLIKEAVKARETRGIVRPDMINLLMQARKGLLNHAGETEQREGFAVVEESEVGKGQATKTMTEPEMIAQCLIFFLAGFDTVSTCLTFLAYELTLNPEIQRKLYEEIVETHETLGGKSLTYDVLQKMKYMDMVVSESLRLWTPIPAVDRLCVKEYTLDDGQGLKFTIEKGTGVWIPLQAIHRDPKYYPNPEKFIPERFSEENRPNINLSTYMPFGVGPRACIGIRFALMEVKAIVYYMLREFSFNRTHQTQVPLKLVKEFSGLTPERGVHVELRSRGK